MKTIEEIRKALQLIHHVATGQSTRAYMSIPADPNRDADLILSAAIDELEQLRLALQRRVLGQHRDRGAATQAEAERDRAREEANAESKLGTVLAGELAAEKQAHFETTKRLFEMQCAAIAIAQQVSNPREEQREVDAQYIENVIVGSVISAQEVAEAIRKLPTTATPLADRRRAEPATRPIEFWSCDPDAERLHESEVEEAVCAWLDDAELADVVWPIKAYGWARVEVTDSALGHAGDAAAERAAQVLDEDEYGDPHGDHEVLNPTARERLAAVITGTLIAARCTGELSSWACQVVETREVTEAQARAWFPDWFKSPEAPCGP